ncbi:MAG: hypothetical protein Q7R97_05510 [Candidatus Daviesbacteria bacterium]|nr:hypothetical protein [Candidatus Daviesbacteria bacterium]
MNVLGTDGASYQFTPDEVIITSYSTYDHNYNNVQTIYKNPCRQFWEWQEVLQQKLYKVNEVYITQE